jgi:hypothetical protein
VVPRAEIEAYFGAPVTFGRGRNELAVTLADFDLPLRSADAALLAVAGRQAMRVVAGAGTDAVVEAP